MREVFVVDAVITSGFVFFKVFKFLFYRRCRYGSFQKDVVFLSLNAVEPGPVLFCFCDVSKNVVPLVVELMCYCVVICCCDTVVLYHGGPFQNSICLFPYFA